MVEPKIMVSDDRRVGTASPPSDQHGTTKCLNNLLKVTPFLFQPRRYYYIKNNNNV